MPNRSHDPMPITANQGNPMKGSEGLVGVFRTLADQHDQVAKLFDQLKATPEARATIWPQLRRELVSHEHSEVRELYPVLRQLDETRVLADHHDEEARELDALIHRLDSLDLQSDKWSQLFDQLVKTVLHHAKAEEEAKIFPVAQQVLGKARAIELDAKVRAAKQQLAAAS
jgi:hemerythrin superfamily protein